MDASDLFPSSLPLWDSDTFPPCSSSVAAVAAAAGEAAADAAAATPSLPTNSVPDASFFADPTAFDDPALAVDSSAFANLASSCIAPDADTIWTHSQPDQPPPPAAHPQTALQSPLLSPRSHPQPAIPFLEQSPSPSSLSPTLETQQAHLYLPMPNNVSALPPTVQLHAQLNSQHHNLPNNRPSSNPHPRTSSHTTGNASSPSPPSRSDSCIRKPAPKRQSATQALRRSKSLNHAQLHPSRTQPPSAQSTMLDNQPAEQHSLAHYQSPSQQPTNLLQMHPPSTTPTTAATPSTTNSTQRSPPRTPSSLPSSRPIALAPARHPDTQIHSSSNNASHPNPPAHFSSHTMLTNTASIQSKSQLTTGSTSTQHPPLHAKSPKITKPRDKYSKLRKRLKCCTKEQLFEHMMHLVHSSVIHEKAVLDNIPSVDINYFVSECQQSCDVIFRTLSDDQHQDSLVFDANAYRKCKKALLAFKNVVLTNGRTLVEASMWIDVIRYCILAAQINAQTPIWQDAAHNKAKNLVHTKLNQLALRALKALSRSKETAFAPDAARLIEACRTPFPQVATMLADLVANHRVQIPVQPAPRLGSQLPNTESSPM